MVCFCYHNYLVYRQEAKEVSAARNVTLVWFLSHSEAEPFPSASQFIYLPKYVRLLLVLQEIFCWSSCPQHFVFTICYRRDCCCNCNFCSYFSHLHSSFVLCRVSKTIKILATNTRYETNINCS